MGGARILAETRPFHLDGKIAAPRALNWTKRIRELNDMSWNDGIIEEFRANEGRVGGIFKGKPLLLLHHVGARTGTERVSPLMYQAVDGGYAVFASKGGADHNPDWYHNLMAHPSVKVEVGTEEVPVQARELKGEEYERVWAKQKAEHPQFAGYERKTSRDRIPAIMLEPA